MDVRSFTVVAAGVALIFAVVAFSRCRSDSGARDVAADRIFRVGRVVALDGSIDADADAIAVRGGEIVSVGRWSSVARSIGAGTEVIDLRPHVAVPGLIDAHAHLVGQGRLGLDLLATDGADAIVRRVAGEVAARPKGTWILGRRWDQNDWAKPVLPDRAALDRVSPDHPVVLTRIDGHALWANSRALALAGVDAATRDPDGGRIVRRPDGAPTGVLVDNAMALIRKHLPPPTRDEIRRAMLDAAATCHRYGLTGIHDAGVSATELEIYRELYRSGELRLRSYAMIGGEGELLERYLARGPEIGACDGRLTVRCVKMYADGALGSRGAALDAPYSDETDTRGLLVTPPDRLHRVIDRSVRAGLQVAVHAIGDRANRIVLDGYEAAIREHEARDPRLRVEHAQVMRLADIDRLARLGVVASMQPTHLTSDGPWAEQRVGSERIRGAYAWRRVMNAGAHLAGGSDFPVERVNPLLGLHAAMTRRRVDEPGAGAVFGPDQVMTPEEALRAFTIEAAYAAFQEDRTGTLTPGKWADITVLPVDPLRDDPDRLLEAEVVATIVAGEVVYRRVR